MRWFVHPVSGGYEVAARQTPNHALQALDAKCSGGLVGRSITGIRYLRALVRTALVVRQVRNG